MPSVLIVEDHALFRSGLKQLIGIEPGLTVAGEAGDGLAGIRLAQSLRPDLILLDISMPELSGVEAIPRIREVAPGARILIVSMHATAGHVRAALKAGADGYLLKDQEPEQILEDIQKAAKGQTVLSASMNQALAECLREESFSKERRLSELTEREKSVLKLIAQGKTNKEIGKALEISDGTVKVHVKHVLHKLSFRSRVEAAVWAKEQKNL